MFISWPARCTRCSAGRPPTAANRGPRSLGDRLERPEEPVEPLPGVDEDLMRVILDGLPSRPPIDPPRPSFETGSPPSNDRRGTAAAYWAAGEARRRFLVVATLIAVLPVCWAGSGSTCTRSTGV